MREQVLKWVKNYIAAHPNPDFRIGDGQLERWYLFRWKYIGGLYIHRFNASDESRALHDHPWASLGWILNEGYLEVLGLGPKNRTVWRPAGSFNFRWPTTAHRVIIQRPGFPVYTLFLVGPTVRQWGFHCPNGWRHWKDFVQQVPGGNQIGKGCE